MADEEKDEQEQAADDATGDDEGEEQAIGISPGTDKIGSKGAEDLVLFLLYF